MISFKSYKYVIILGIVSFLLLFSNIWTIRQCSNNSRKNDNNIVALTDSIKYHKTKANELYVSKTLLEGDLKSLKIANDSLYNVIKSMKEIKNPSSIVYIKQTVDNGKKDTAWVIKKDTLIKYPILLKEFSFDNQFRALNGNVFFKDSILGLNIINDKVFMDYTIAIEKNQVFVKSNNPYIQFNKIQGITIPEPQRRLTSLVIGPSVSYGYDLQEKKFAPSINLSVTYGIDLINLFKR
jgi:hypothetical protein